MIKSGYSLRRESAEVYYIENCDHIDDEVLGHLVELGSTSESGKVRFCLHKSVDSLVHQMIIYHRADCFVPIHRHVGKSESLLVLKGSVGLIKYDSAGSVVKTIRLNEAQLNLAVNRESEFHTVVILTDFAVFLETTKGPFRKLETEFFDINEIDISLHLKEYCLAKRKAFFE